MACFGFWVEERTNITKWTPPPPKEKPSKKIFIKMLLVQQKQTKAK